MQGTSLVCTENRSFGYTCILFQSGSSKKVVVQRACVFVCRITVEAKYVGLYLLTLLIIGEGSSHTQSSSRQRSIRAPWPLHHALAIRSISNPSSTRRSLCKVPFGSSE